MSFCRKRNTAEAEIGTLCFCDSIFAISLTLLPCFFRALVAVSSFNLVMMSSFMILMQVLSCDFCACGVAASRMSDYIVSRNMPVLCHFVSLLGAYCTFGLR